MECNIVLITDTKYVMPTLVTIKSIVTNQNDKIICNIYLLYRKVSEDQIESIKSLSTDTVKITPIEIQNDLINKIPNPRITDLPASKTSVLKFIIPELFPSIEKILYLDTDIIVRNNLTDLFAIDISDYYCAAVKEVFLEDNPDYQRKCVDKYPYFNSGVMLLNLKKMRADGISTKLIDYRLNNVNDFMDQDSFNYIFREHVLFIEPKYNLMCHNLVDHGYETVRDYYNLKIEKSELKNYAVVVHYPSYKPWEYSDLDFNDEWDQYYQTLFSNKITGRKVINNRSMVNRIKNKMCNLFDNVFRK